MSEGGVGEPGKRTRARQFIPVAEPVLGEAEAAAVADAVLSGWISSLGEQVTRFEERLADICGVRHAVSVCNGTAALHLALLVAGVGPEDEVIVPAMTFIATANAVRYVGAEPVFADCDRDHWCLTPAEVERLVTPRTRAIVPVHLYGHPADVDAIRALADDRGIAVIEDAAEAIGATQRGRPVGSLANVGIFSFYGNKLITTGEGGALTTDDPELARRATALRDHAMDHERRYWHDVVGFNYRLTNLQAALGVVQLGRLDEFLACKRAIASRYAEGLRQLLGLTFQAEAEWAGSSKWMTTILVEESFPLDRDALGRRLGELGIDTRPAFVPLHLLPPYRSDVSLPVSERIGRTGLTLPSAASLSDEDQSAVVEAITDAAGR
ncbi:MAG: DegT/DnrJ/EryC1/StrS family aminotransferase [Gaiellaceae bacterium]